MTVPASLDLHVIGHLSAEDARRQERSAATILERFANQPGVILGDEVGMGKTFVALAVAASYVVRDPSRPVVVMVPSQVVRKWQRDAGTFKQACLRNEEDRTRFRVKVAETGVDFLKLLDDKGEAKATVIVLSHGALHRKLGDGWVKLAVLQAAIKGRHGVDELRKRLARFGPMLLWFANRPDQHYDLFLRLLQNPPTSWKKILVENEWLTPDANDPVPEAVVHALDRVDLQTVFDNVVNVIPERTSGQVNERIKAARWELNNTGSGALPRVLRDCLRTMKLSLPLLVLDEAHRTRNAGTQLAKLLAESKDDLDAAGGQLAGRFDRMLFLTATPFQLGHSELRNVLSRFEAINWRSASAPSMTPDGFKRTIASLHADLDEMQHATDGLERAWKRVIKVDLEEAVAAFGEDWWALGESQPDFAFLEIPNDRTRGVVLAYRKARAAIIKAEHSLRPWVLRHARPTHLPPPYEAVARRERIEGASVLRELGSTGHAASPASSGGLRVSAETALPFLLGARITTIPELGRTYGEAIASSYEALLNTKRDEEAEADESSIGVEKSERAQRYVRELRTAVEGLEGEGYRLHPKLKATVDLAMELWRRGEKVLVFCHYRETGAALHRYLSEAMNRVVTAQAMASLSCTAAHVQDELVRIATNLESRRPAARDALDLVEKLLTPHKVLWRDDLRADMHDIVLRFLRTPTFLVRFAPLAKGKLPSDWVQQCFSRPDESGMTLTKLLSEFFSFLALRPSDIDREAYIYALKKVQTGTHAGRESEESYGDDERSAAGRVKLVANVRRVYGDTKDETRERLMLTFNTPFYPEILIASSVMAEGVDLHLSCRHVIHHDLDWNPSSLEQRTGRIDRLGAKAERAGRPIRVYIPYVEGCQDEKLFRVVAERERWFGVVMGAEASMQKILSASAWEIERMAQQPEVPAALIRALTMNLSSVVTVGPALTTMGTASGPP